MRLEGKIHPGALPFGIWRCPIDLRGTTPHAAALSHPFCHPVSVEVHVGTAPDPSSRPPRPAQSRLPLALVHPAFDPTFDNLRPVRLAVPPAAVRFGSIGGCTWLPPPRYTS
jgi:hypothetical protein